MSRSQQIQARLDVGDNAGAVRLAAREKIANIKKVQRNEHELQLAALAELVRRHPEINHEFYGGQIRQSLAKLGLRGTTIDDMEAALRDVQQTLAQVVEYEEARRQTYEQAPAPPPTTARQSQSERRAERRAASNAPEDSITAEAKQLITSGRISLESIAQMTAVQYERAISSPVFNRCLELLEPPRDPSPLTLGELQQAHGEAHRLNQQEQRTVITADIVRAVEESKRAHWTSVYQDAPAPSMPSVSRGVVNLNRDAHVPKSLTAREIAAGRRQEAADHEFIDNSRTKSARRKHVIANRRGQ
jgi:hypothetical protein